MNECLKFIYLLIIFSKLDIPFFFAYNFITFYKFSTIFSQIFYDQLTINRLKKEIIQAIRLSLSVI
jgi:hypothetical protein